MLKGHNGRDVRMIGLVGSESIGKTSTGYMLAGRLRGHGALAEFVTDSSGAMPFPPDRFDTHVEAWAHVLATKIARETEFALRPNVDLIVSDRTPLDLLAYASMKHPKHPLLRAFTPLVGAWMKVYDVVYFLPAAGTEFRSEGFREPTADSREYIDRWFHENLDGIQRGPEGLGDRLVVAPGSYRERAEIIYHDALARFCGATKPNRTAAQVKAALTDDETMRRALGHTPHVAEVRLLGSRSITRFHRASDQDDTDLLVVLERTSPVSPLALHYALRMASTREYLESLVQGSLDIAVCWRGEEPHEV